MTITRKSDIQIAFPMVREGDLEDGRFFLFTYRYGVATLVLGKTTEDVHRDHGMSVEFEADLPGWLNETQFESAFTELYSKIEARVESDAEQSLPLLQAGPESGTPRT